MPVYLIRRDVCSSSGLGGYYGVNTLRLRRGAQIELVGFITTFFGGNLGEDVYISLQKSYDAYQTVYKLSEIMYGLRRIPLNCYVNLSTTIRALGFKALPEADCVYVRRSERSMVLLLVFADYKFIIIVNGKAGIRRNSI